jgi:acetyl-CoA carboxylase biotin carboxyl carrier protein
MSKDIKVDADAVRKLATILDDTDLTEIEYEDSGRRIRVARKVTTAPVVTHVASSPSVTAPIIAQEATPEAPSLDADPKSHPGCVTSPMVGTAYLAAEPGAAPFIKEGHRVSQGDTLMIVEAMKVMNPIKAFKAGIIKKIFVQDGMPLEFGEPLIIIE